MGKGQGPLGAPLLKFMVHNPHFKSEYHYEIWHNDVEQLPSYVCQISNRNIRIVHELQHNEILRDLGAWPTTL